MSSYGQFCPVAQALEIVGERWTLLIIRELLCGNYRFNELLNGVPLISRSLLSQRLKMLEEAGLVERRQREGAGGFEYQLTAAGVGLKDVVLGLGFWGKRFIQRRLSADELDPVLLMWDVRRRLKIERLPNKRTVVLVWFRDLPAKRSRYWLCVENGEVELCLTHPGFDVDLTLETKLRTLVEVWMGLRSWDAEVAAGALELKGTAEMTRAFPEWLMFNSFNQQTAVSA